MGVRRVFHLAKFALLTGLGICAAAQSSSAPASSKDHHTSTARKISAEPEIDAGAIVNNVYSNRSLGITCKVPVGWVFRTDEMNAPDEDEPTANPPQNTQANAVAKPGRLLLAAFSRPPGASGEDVNASIVIAVESVKAYPGLADAAQYVLGPITDAAKAQGFSAAEEPYEFAVGTRKLPRADFQKDIGTHVARQSTIAMLVRGYVVSFTFAAGTEDDVDELVEGLSFAAAAKSAK